MEEHMKIKNMGRKSGNTIGIKGGEGKEAKDNGG
jgi:hypothetical protein